jgi:hypothetical protein
VPEAGGCGDELRPAGERDRGVGLERAGGDAGGDGQDGVAGPPERDQGVAGGAAGIQPRGLQALGDHPALQVEGVVGQRRGDGAGVRRPAAEGARLAERSQDAEGGRRTPRDRLGEEEFVVGELPGEPAGGGEGSRGGRDGVRLADVVAGAGADCDRRGAGRLQEPRVDDGHLDVQPLEDGAGNDRRRRTAGGRDGNDRRADRGAVDQYLGVGARRVREQVGGRAGGADAVDLGRPGRPGREHESSHYDWCSCKRT